MKGLYILAIAAILVFAGCAQTGRLPPGKNGTNSTPPQGNGTGLANPASVYCGDMNYSLDIRTDASGGQSGYCEFPNGRECEEWAFFRGECTDADSFEMVESPGFVAFPKSITYKFYSDGRLVLTTKDLRNGNSSSLMAWLKPRDFAAFVKSARDSGFESFSGSYNTCGGNDCPTDMPYVSLRLLAQGREKTVGIYAPADRPENLDNLIASFKKLFEENSFVEASASGCTLMQSNVTGELACFGCSSGITNVKCSAPSAGFEKVEAGGSMGSCAVDVQGACAYLPPGQMTENLCKSSRGMWNECASACRGAPEGTPCILMCVQECECGGFAGFRCPTGFFCADYLPKGAADAMGVCRPLQ
ncbi:Uncharacterised protein [uncultured archaeon]|nr:Uncharacterised protein [uncultured archaeon]